MNFGKCLSEFGDKMAASFAVIAKLAMGLIVVSVTVDALGRYLFSSPIQGTQAIVEGMLQPAVVFLAAGLAARMDGHMRVDLIRLEGMPNLLRFREALFSFLIFCFWGICSWQAGLRAWDAYLDGQWPVGQIETPTVVAYGIVSVGGFVAAICHLIPRQPSRQ